MTERYSRSSISEFVGGGGPPTPLKAIISTIKAVKGNIYVPEFDPSAKYKTDVQDEQILLNRKQVKIRKVYLTSSLIYKGSVFS